MKKIAMVMIMVAASHGVMAGETNDEAAIRATVTKYIQGWFQSKPELMKAACHPNLAKYNVEKIAGKSVEVLKVTTRERLVGMCGINQDWLKDVPFKADITVLYQDERMAVVRLVSTEFYDQMGLMKLNGEWKIVQVMWDFVPQNQGAKPDKKPS